MAVDGDEWWRVAEAVHAPVATLARQARHGGATLILPANGSPGAALCLQEGAAHA